MEGAALPTVPMDCFDLFDVFRNLSVYNETRFLAIYRLYFADVGYVVINCETARCSRIDDSILLRRNRKNT